MQPHLTLEYGTGTGRAVRARVAAEPAGGVAQTSRGIPRYADAAGPGVDQPDVFILSGAEDLVQVAGSYPGRVRYQPRTEGLFARIEHVRDGSGDYWDFGAKDGTRTGRLAVPAGAPAGRRDPAAAADPDDPSRIAAWRITRPATRWQPGPLRVPGRPGRRAGTPLGPALISRISYATTAIRRAVVPRPDRVRLRGETGRVSRPTGPDSNPHLAALPDDPRGDARRRRRGADHAGIPARVRGRHRSTAPPC